MWRKTLVVRKGPLERRSVRVRVPERVRVGVRVQARVQEQEQERARARMRVRVRVRVGVQPNLSRLPPRPPFHLPHPQLRSVAVGTPTPRR